MNHLLDRMADRSIDSDALEALAAWLDKEPEVPEGAWFHRMQHLIVCGKGELVLTFLKPEHVAVGEEVKSQPDRQKPRL
jgi:hypothetical protein